MVLAAALPPGSPLEAVLGPVAKRGAVMRSTEPWEHDVNNGYSSMLYDPAGPAGAKYRVYYSASDPGFGATPGYPRGLRICEISLRSATLTM